MKGAQKMQKGMSTEAAVAVGLAAVLLWLYVRSMELRFQKTLDEARRELDR